MPLSSIIIGAAVGLGLSACYGFRVFIPLLVAGLAIRIGVLQAGTGFLWLASYPVLICFATAAIAEGLGYYIPIVDHLLDTIAAPVAIVAGSVLSAATLVHLDPAWQWILGLIIGGTSAGLVQVGTSVARLGSTNMTAGVANPLLASVEILFALGGTIAVLLAPLVMAVVAILLLIAIIYSLSALRRKVKQLQ